MSISKLMLVTNRKQIEEMQRMALPEVKEMLARVHAAHNDTVAVFAKHGLSETEGLSEALTLLGISVKAVRAMLAGTEAPGLLNDAVLQDMVRDMVQEAEVPPATLN
jgi:hypothetical protein